MKRTLSLLLIALTIPVNAQPPTDRFDLARAITREAERFAEYNPSSRPAGSIQATTSVRSDWSRVRVLATGTRVTVTVHGVQYVSRYFVTADDVEITVLNKVPGHEPLVERFASHEITEIRADLGPGPGTFMGNFGGLFVIGAVIAGSVGGGMLGHRQFARYKPLGAALGAYGGLAVGMAAGLAIMGMGGAFREDVIYRAP